MIALTPYLAANSTVSDIGKKASDAKYEPDANSLACSSAILAAPTRFIWPAPTPTVILSFTKAIAFDFTCFTTLNPNNNCSKSSCVGFTSVTHSKSSSVTSSVSKSCCNNPPLTVVNLWPS